MMRTYKRFSTYIAGMWIVLICILCLVAMAETHHDKIIAQMDSRELCYDADGYLILYDSENCLVGIYNGTEPLLHRTYVTGYELYEGQQELYTIEDLPEIQFLKQWVPDETRVLIY